MLRCPEGLQLGLYIVVNIGAEALNIAALARQFIAIAFDDRDRLGALEEFDECRCRRILRAGPQQHRLLVDQLVQRRRNQPARPPGTLITWLCATKPSSAAPVETN